MRDLVKTVKHLLKPTGRFYVMYPPLRLEELVINLAKVGIKIQRIGSIHPFADRPASQVMVEAVPAATRELTWEPPLVVYRDVDHYTPEVEAWVGKKRRV